jgi:predicted porin
MIDAYRRILTLITMNGLAIAPTLALEYSLEYGVTAGYESNDNVALEPEQETSIVGGSVSIPVILGIRSERLEATLSNEFVSSRFDDESYDSDDDYLGGRVVYLFEKSKLEGYANYAQESTRTSEFLDTGVVGNKSTGVDSVGVGGEASHSFTEINGIIGGIDYSEVDYQSELYQDYKFISGSLGWTHRRSERMRLRLQGYGNRYEDAAEAAVATSTDGAGIQLGFDYNVTGRIDAQLLMGWVWVDTRYDTTPPESAESPEDNRDNKAMLTGSLSYTGERYQLIAHARSSPTPSGDGNLQFTQEIDLGYSYDLNEYASLGIGLLAGQSQAADNRIDQNRDYARAQVGLEYRLSTSWSVAASYQYSFQNQDGSEDQLSGNASSNAVFLSLVYQPSKTVWSR